MTVAIGLVAALLAGVLWRAGMTRAWVGKLSEAAQDRAPRPIELRIWDWWSPSGNEKYGTYMNDVERIFEERNPDVDLVYQMVPFGNYVQKLSTAMVGRRPPDVFQSSVHWAEGFYNRGMLRPLNDLLAGDGGDTPATDITEAAFMPSAWRHNHSGDGTVFGIPQIIDANCLVWNLDLLKVAAETDQEIRDMFPRLADGTTDYSHIRFDAIRSWPHFRSIVNKLTLRDDEGRLIQAGLVIQGHGGGGGMFEPWLAANGGSYQDSAGTKALFNSTNGVEALTFMAELYWEDRVCPPFQRNLNGADVFEKRQVAAMMAGTWSGKDIIRDTQGWQGFGKTAFPPGPLGAGQRTTCWGNMLVITRKCRNVEAAWRYIKFVCSLEGNVLRARHLGYNGPRLDFYDTDIWQQKLRQFPYLSNVKQICLAGHKLRHTEIAAVDHQAVPIFETVLLNYPEIKAGRGSYASIQEALDLAAKHVGLVYQRYNTQVEGWRSMRAAQQEVPR
jgi:ABC-type glycerol-3-phosphate transport system substrate-binding protein